MVGVFVGERGGFGGDGCEDDEVCVVFRGKGIAWGVDLAEKRWEEKDRFGTKGFGEHGVGKDTFGKMESGEGVVEGSVIRTFLRFGRP